MIRTYQKEVAYFIGIAAIAFIVLYFCLNVVKPSAQSQIDAHSWLHEQIHLTAEQDRALTQIEKKFAEKQRELQAEIHAGNVELANVMMEDRKFSDRVAAAVERIHHAQGDLQKATIEHIFDMQTVLTPEQAEKLNKLAADALIQNP
ncbi:MAG: periplasmic heavy metal sensor [Alphaproteobacteria bacterium]|nr:periplasmic heavy metal sensor [Alphaproteobacteria bacterium]